MANRFPLVVDSSTQQIKELSENDNLDLTSNTIVGVTSITASGIISASSFYGDGSNLTGIEGGGGGGISESQAIAYAIALG